MRPPSVILSTVETPVYERLDASSQGLNRAAITRVEATTTSWGSCTSWPVADMLAMRFNLIASCYRVTLTTTAAITRAKGNNHHYYTYIEE